MNTSTPRRAGGFAREEIFLISVLGVLFATFIVLVVLLIGSERNKNTLLAEYEADRAASALVETYREEIFNAREGGSQESTISTASLPSDVRGFGIYAFNGLALRAVGDAPRTIANLLSRVQPRLFRFNPGAGTIELVRVLGAMPRGPGQQMRFRNQDQRARVFGMMGQAAPPFVGPNGAMPPRPAVAPAYVYIKLSTHAFFSNRSLLTLALVLVPIALGAAMLVVLLFYFRNRRYRAKIESQAHLVHLGEIARTLSHEIKNPLSSIRLQTGIMRRVYEGNSPRELTVIEEETSRLTELVERIGEFLRDPTGRPERIDVVEFIRDLLSRFDWQVERLDLPSEAAYLDFDRNRLRTVLENIFKNASESGGENTSFSVSVQATRQRVEIRVVDRGTGIPEDLREKIFDPFYTTKVKGSGIGLAISKRFVEAAGGALVLENAKEGGGEARITLKRSVEPHSEKS